MDTETKPETKYLHIQRVKWALLNEWWCAPLSATEDEIAGIILGQFLAPCVTLELIKDRLFGGFRCECDGNRHIYFATGHYTYTGTHQEPLSAGDRAETWGKLISENYTQENGAFIGGGPFTGDAPKREQA